MRVYYNNINDGVPENVMQAELKQNSLVTRLGPVEAHGHILYYCKSLLQTGQHVFNLRLRFKNKETGCQDSPASSFSCIGT